MTAVDTTARPWTLIPDAFWTGLRQLVAPYVIASFDVPGAPQPKERRVGSGRGAFTPAKTVTAEKRVLSAFTTAMPDWEPEPDGTYGVLIEFVGEENSRSDLDNLTKLVWDALNTNLWQDDVQVGMALLHLTRYGDPGTRVWVFGMTNNGTRLTTECECGNRYRSAAKMCAVCTRRKKAVAELLGDDPDQAAADLAQLKRRTFTFLAHSMAGAGRTPSFAAIAEHLGVSETRARAAVDELIAAGNVERLTSRKLKIVQALGGAA